MKRSLIVGISGAVALAAIVGGYWAGMRSGIELAHGSHAAETGAVAVAELTLLEAGHTDKAKLFLEAGVDDGLAGWSDLTSMRARLSEYIFGPRAEPSLGNGVGSMIETNQLRPLVSYFRVSRSHR
jgi:hypothetical protein